MYINNKEQKNVHSMCDFLIYMLYIIDVIISAPVYDS